MLLTGIFTVLFALGVVFSRKPLNCALHLVGTLFLVAIHFALLGAHFVAAVQVLVYAGAIMVLVVFVIMLLGVEASNVPAASRVSCWMAAMTCAVFVAMLWGIVPVLGKASPYIATAPVVPEVSQLEDLGSTEAIGKVLYTKFLFPFEITSLLLLAAIVGAVMLAHEPKRPLLPGRGLKANRREVTSLSS